MSDEEDAAPEGAYEVGYGKPPLHIGSNPATSARRAGRPVRRIRRTSCLALGATGDPPLSMANALGSAIARLQLSGSQGGPGMGTSKLLRKV